MRPTVKRSLGLALASAMLIATASAGAAIRQFSYDPADAGTRAAAGPVTLVINQTMFGTRVLKLRSTTAKATVDLTRGEPGRLPAEVRGTLYRIADADDGPAFVAALCPGSKRAWLALSGVHYGAAVRAQVLGDAPSGGPIKLCRTLDFTFHGEWAVPAHRQIEIDPVAPPDFPN